VARVVLTGASGLVGATLEPALQARGHEVIRLDREANRSGEARTVSADFADAGSLARALDRSAPDVIFNLAAMTNVDECQRAPADAYQANTRLVEYLARWVRTRESRVHLVQMSTDQVYDGTGPHEEDRVRPINYYAFSKLGGEIAASAVGATVLRTNLFGRSRAPARSSISDWIVGVLRRREAARVFDDVLFSPLSLETLAGFATLAVDRRLGGVYNLGSRDGFSKAEFAFRLGATLGLATDLLTRTQSGLANLLAPRPKDMRMDCGRFERAFGVLVPTLDSEIQLMRQAYENAA
jgi:dTDP-4-dehydrorhamnose reductase